MVNCILPRTARKTDFGTLCLLDSFIWMTAPMSYTLFSGVATPEKKGRRGRIQQSRTRNAQSVLQVRTVRGVTVSAGTQRRALSQSVTKVRLCLEEYFVYTRKPRILWGYPGLYPIATKTTRCGTWIPLAIFGDDAFHTNCSTTESICPTIHPCYGVL